MTGLYPILKRSVQSMKLSSTNKVSHDHRSSFFTDLADILRFFKDPSGFDHVFFIFFSMVVCWDFLFLFGFFVFMLRLFRDSSRFFQFILEFYLWDLSGIVSGSYGISTPFLEDPSGFSRGPQQISMIPKSQTVQWMEDRIYNFNSTDAGVGGSSFRDATLSSADTAIQSRADLHVGPGRFVHFPLPRVAPWPRPHQLPFLADLHHPVQSTHLLVINEFDCSLLLMSCLLVV